MFLLKALVRAHSLLKCPRGFLTSLGADVHEGVAVAT